MSKRKIKLKIISTLVFSIVILDQTFFAGVPHAEALFGGFKVPSASSIAKDMEQYFHIDHETSLDITDSLRVSEKKAAAPSVEVTFLPENPEPGEKVTAIATTKYFDSDPKDMYFTWYLVNGTDPKTGDSSRKVIEKLKHDNDNSSLKKIENFKKNAAEIIARGNFEVWEANDDDDLKNPYNGNDDDKDNDGYEAFYGGENRSLGQKYCYVHNFETGKQYELRKKSGKQKHFYTDPQKFNICNNPACVEEENLVCSGSSDASASGSGGTGGSGGSGGDGSGAGGSGGSAGTGGDAAACSTNTPFVSLDLCIDTQNDPSCVDEIPLCPSGQRQVCLDNFNLDENNNCNGIIATDETIPPDGCKETLTNTQPSPISCSSLPPLKSCEINKNNDDENLCKHLFAGWEDDSNWQADGIKNQIGAKDEKFKKKDEKDWGTNPNDPDTAGKNQVDEATIAGLGQMEFSWIYQPGDKVGVVVEGTSLMKTKHDDSGAMVMWAFVNNTCNINPGENGLDKDANFSTYTINTGGYDTDIETIDFNLNKCLTHKEAYLDPAQGSATFDVKLTHTPELPVNDTTEATDDDGNYIDTADGGDGVADTVNYGDIVTVNSIIDQEKSRGRNFQYYKWKIDYDDDQDIDTPDWRYINNPEDYFKTVLTKMEGNSLDSLKFKLDINPTNADKIFDSGLIGYLRIRLEVYEHFSDGSVARKGRASDIIKVTNATNRIDAKNITIEGSSPPYTVKNASGTICNTNGLTQSVCFVTQNEIIGLEANIDDDLEDKIKNINYHWTINDQPFICNTDVSDDCKDTTETEVNFFPALGEPGTTYNVTVSINGVSSDGDENGTGDVIQMSRTFVVVKPFMTITIADTDNVTDGIQNEEVWQKELGYYIDDTGSVDGSGKPDDVKAYTDLSTNTFETLYENKPKLQIWFSPEYITWSGKTFFRWIVDGRPLTNADLDTIHGGNFIIKSTSSDPTRQDEGGFTLEFTANKKPGDAYVIGAEGKYSFDNKYRQALEDIWGIPQQATNGAEMETSVLVEILAGEDDYREFAFTNPGSFFASLASHVPSYILFLIRTILAVTVILVTTSLVFALTPNYKREESEY